MLRAYLTKRSYWNHRGPRKPPFSPYFTFDVILDIPLASSSLVLPLHIKTYHFLQQLDSQTVIYQKLSHAHLTHLSCDICPKNNIYTVIYREMGTFLPILAPMFAPKTW